MDWLADSRAVSDRPSTSRAPWRGRRTSATGPRPPYFPGHLDAEGADVSQFLHQGLGDLAGPVDLVRVDVVEHGPSACRRTREREPAPLDRGARDAGGRGRGETDREQLTNEARVLHSASRAASATSRASFSLARECEASGMAVLQARAGRERRRPSRLLWAATPWTSRTLDRRRQLALVADRSEELVALRGVLEPSTPAGDDPSITPMTPRPCAVCATDDLDGIGGGTEDRADLRTSLMRPSTLMGKPSRSTTTNTCPAPMAVAFRAATVRSISSLPSTRVRHGPDASLNATPNFICGTAVTMAS